MLAPNRIEVTLFGIAAGALIVARLGVFWVVIVSVGIALASYAWRTFVQPQYTP